MFNNKDTRCEFAAMLKLSEAEFISVNNTFLIRGKENVKGYMQCQRIFTTIDKSNQTVHDPKISSAEY